jgi:CDP-paratose 2-epimerase
VNALLLACGKIDSLAGQAFNIGGGVQHSASLLEVVEEIRRIHGSCDVKFDDWRPSDQRYYVSNTRKFQAATGWSPQVGVDRGIEQLYAWAAEQRNAGRLSSPRAVAVAQDSAGDQAS